MSDFEIENELDTKSEALALIELLSIGSKQAAEGKHCSVNEVKAMLRSKYLNCKEKKNEH